MTQHFLGRRFLLGLTFLALFIGITASKCGDGGGNNTSPALTAQLAALLCQHETSVLLAADESVFTTCNVDDLLFPDMQPAQACNADSPVYKRLLSSMQSSRFKVDSAKAQTCITKYAALLKSITGKNVSTVATQLLSHLQSSECTSYAVGQVGAGQPCTLHKDCSSNLVCRPNEKDETKLICQKPFSDIGGDCKKETTIVDCGKNAECGFDGTCVSRTDYQNQLAALFEKRKGSGFPCAATNDCSPCLICRPESVSSATTKCLPRATEAIRCDDNRQCDRSFYCDDKTDVCTARPNTDSAPCGNGSFCAEGFSCLGDFGKKTCRKNANPGGNCYKLASCESGNVCAGGTCAPSSGALGQACGLDKDCDWLAPIRTTSPMLPQSPYYCNDNKCDYGKSANGKCDALRSECREGTKCIFLNCKESQAGAPCKFPVDCDSGRCSDKGLCEAVIPLF